MPALLLPLAEAVPLLARARHLRSAHPATRCWGAATLHALHLVSRGRILPGLTADDHDAWRAGPRDAEDVAHLRAVAAAMPAEGYATPFPDRTPLQLPDPEPLISSFLDAVADTLPRTPSGRLRHGRTLRRPGGPPSARRPRVGRGGRGRTGRGRTGVAAPGPLRVRALRHRGPGRPGRGPGRRRGKPRAARRCRHHPGAQPRRSHLRRRRGRPVERLGGRALRPARPDRRRARPAPRRARLGPAGTAAGPAGPRRTGTHRGRVVRAAGRRMGRGWQPPG